jgi:hypothetical protein
MTLRVNVANDNQSGRRFLLMRFIFFGWNGWERWHHAKSKPNSTSSFYQTRQSTEIAHGMTKKDLPDAQALSVDAAKPGRSVPVFRSSPFQTGPCLMQSRVATDINGLPSFLASFR